MSLLSSLSPLHQNLLASALPVLYVKAVVGGSDYAVEKKWLSPQVSRKVIHVAAGSFLLFWPLFNPSHWTWRLNVLVPAVYSVQLFVKGALLRNKADPDVRTMTRTGDPTELLYGPLFFTLVMCTCGLYLFNSEQAVLIMACLGFGDGVAPLVGSRFPWGRYPTFPFGRKDFKTLSGSLAFLLSSLAGYSFFQSILFGTSTVNLFAALPVVTMATITEGLTGGFDNIMVPIAVYVLSNQES